MGIFNTGARLARDIDSHPIQVLRADDLGTEEIAITGSSQSSLLPVASDSSAAVAEVIEVTVTQAARFCTGVTSGTSATTAKALNPGTFTYQVPAGHLYFAVVAVGSPTGSDVCTVTRMY